MLEKEVLEYNPLCKCKSCTGEGLGWIQHLTKEQTNRRLDRLCAERERELFEVGLLDNYQLMYYGRKP